jgi:hypothetical protein
LFVYFPIALLFLTDMGEDVPTRFSREASKGGFQCQEL